ncbi:MAG: hypothetical protein OSB18_06550 [SAR324 cluster bacterium]|jgi:hypothetical protein|nr:hypothetical protein [SAR324 cluster bacterium]|tara:strand:+ start:4190 stop:5191 length:1002 start_codon:yes stop_codon:yes gene_type:complete
MAMSADLETLQARLGDALTPEALLRQAAVAAPPNIPVLCFPELIPTLLEGLLEHEWNQLGTRAQNYLRWISVKAESIDVLAPKDVLPTTRGFELLAIHSTGDSFGKILEKCRSLEIPSVLIRFSTLISAFLTVRLLKQQIEQYGDTVPSLLFTQNVDADYLNYPRALRTALELFPESQSTFCFEVNEALTEDYLSTLRTLSEDLHIRLVLDDTNQMDDTVQRELMDLAEWIKIDYQATQVLEQRLREGEGGQIVWQLAQYAHASRSPVIVFEGLGEHAPLKTYLAESWSDPETVLYYQSRERVPLPPWDRYFGLIQDHTPEEYGLFFKGLIAD